MTDLRLRRVTSLRGKLITFWNKIWNRYGLTKIQEFPENRHFFLILAQSKENSYWYQNR